MVETICLDGVSPAGLDPRPTILSRTDDDFLAAILADLSGPDGLEAVGRTAMPAPISGALGLFQPVHRTFHVVLLQAYCDRIGVPRLDPTRIESAGLVVRRIAEDPPLPVIGRTLARRKRNGRVNLEQHDFTVRQPDQPEVLEGWMQSGKNLRGWMALGAAPDDKLDPDPARRHVPALLGDPFLDRLLVATGAEPPTESVAPLFVAPPDVATATGRTILYGLVPVTSSEQSEVPTPPPGFSGEAVAAHLHPFLQANARRSVARPGQAVRPDITSDQDLASFVQLLRQLAIELDAFGTSSEAQAVFAALNRIILPFGRAAGKSELAEESLATDKTGLTRLAGDYLREATGVLLNKPATDTQSTVRMPDYWPTLSQEQEDRLLSAATASMTRRLQVVAPFEGRFHDPERRYRLRAFVRVAMTDGCPPETIWSEYSPPFTIAPWYASGNAPPVQVRLPDPMDRGFLEKVKPNVSFIVPESLFNLLNQNEPKKFLEGSAGGGQTSIALDWICGFSIPIITICAFIVLYIFLTLFDLIFRWLLFIKICIPFPRVQRSGS